MKTVFLLALLTVVSLFQGCLQSSAGTDVDNAIVAGTVMDGNQPAVSAKVSIMPVDYNPMRGDSTGRARSQRTSPDGTFMFVDMPPGLYAVEALNSGESRMDWIDTVAVVAGEKTNLTADLDTAKSLYVILPASAPADAYLYVPGSNIYSVRTAPQDSAVLLGHVPRTLLPAIIMGSQSDPIVAETLFTDVPAATDTLWAQ